MRAGERGGGGEGRGEELGLQGSRGHRFLLSTCGRGARRWSRAARPRHGRGWHSEALVPNREDATLQITPWSFSLFQDFEIYRVLGI